MRTRSSLLWLVLAVGAEAVVAAVDLLSSDVVFTTWFLLPVLALSLVARPSQMIAVAVLAFVLAILSGLWDDYFLTTDHLVRLTVIAAGALVAVASARVREEATEERARMAVLADVARITDAPTLSGALDRLGDALVPAVARCAWVDLGEEEGTRRRALERGPDPGGADRIVVPLRVRERAIGGLGVAARAFRDDDRAFLDVLAGRVALALDNVQLVSELSRTRERLDRILGALAEAVTVHDAEGRTIYANDAARELLGVTADAELPSQPGVLASRFIITHEDGSPVTLDEFPGRRLVAGEPAPPLLTRSVRRDTGHEYWLLTKATLLHDEEGSPLAVNVIEDVTEAKEAELRQRFLDEAGQVLASSLDYQQALQHVADLATPWLADWCGVDLSGPRGPERVAVAHADPSKLRLAEELTRRYPPEPDAPTGVPAVLRTGRPERYVDIPDELLVQSARDEEHLRLIRAIGMRAAMIVPMAAGDEVVGAMTFVSAESERTFDDDDYAFAQDLARRAATAVQNGRLYAEQVRVARTLQRSLIPERLPPVPGWEAAASYEAGDERAEVGGDFYDVVATEGGHLVLLGDVTGKGVEAAALTALVRHSAQTAARFDRRPSSLLGLVNAVLREQPRLAPVSLVCALIEGGDVEPPRATVASAGHPLPLLRRSGEPPREVGCHDVLLGVVDQDAFAEASVELEVGDTLLFYTDGVLDAPGEHDRFGEERLHAAVAAAPPEPAALLETIERALRAFVVRRGGADDRAMLALRHTGPLALEGAGAPLASAEA